MGILDGLRRALHRMAESDEQRLADEIQSWAETVPGSTRIAEAPLRSRANGAGPRR